MASEVVKVVQQAGLIEDDTVRELRRWGAPIAVPPPGPPVPTEIVPALIERAMQAQDFVQVKETDLEVLQEYLHTQQDGQLALAYLNGSTETVGIRFGRTATGEFIVPWVDENIGDILGDCLVSLTGEGVCVNLQNPRELYYGDKKVFVLWSVAP